MDFDKYVEGKGLSESQIIDLKKKIATHDDVMNEAIVDKEVELTPLQKSWIDSRISDYENISVPEEDE